MFRWPLLTAILITLLNAAKPVCVDDAYYLRLAREIAKQPLEPYGPPPLGFETIWGGEPQGAFTILAPPVLPYYLALSISRFGDEPVLLKLALFPLIWLFTASIHCLAKKFTPEQRTEVLFLVSLSAATLPCWNLMLDLPALALGLASFALFSQGLDSRQYKWFVASGVLLALAFETKYNAIGFVVLLTGWGFARREYRRTVLAGAVALFLVVCWELSVARIYGESHFLLHSFRRIGLSTLDQKLGGESRTHLILPLIGTFGAIAPYLWLFAVRSRVGRGVGLGVLTLLLSAVFFVPVNWQILTRTESGLPRLTFSGILFVACGLLNLLALVYASWKTPRRILVAWVVVELAVAFAMSPFCAARRVIGCVVASSFLLAASEEWKNRHLVRYSVLWALLWWGVDRMEARVEPDAVHSIAREFPQKRIWFSGNWGFADAAERVGWNTIIPGQSLLQKGDTVVVAMRTERFEETPVWMTQLSRRGIKGREFWNRLPIRTIPDWYGGKLPFQRWEGPALVVWIFRISEPFPVPPSGERVAIPPARADPEP